MVRKNVSYVFISCKFRTSDYGLGQSSDALQVPKDRSFLDITDKEYSG